MRGIISIPFELAGNGTSGCVDHPLLLCQVTSGTQLVDRPPWVLDQVQVGLRL